MSNIVLNLDLQIDVRLDDGTKINFNKSVEVESNRDQYFHLNKDTSAGAYTDELIENVGSSHGWFIIAKDLTDEEVWLSVDQVNADVHIPDNVQGFVIIDNQIDNTWYMQGGGNTTLEIIQVEMP